MCTPKPSPSSTLGRACMASGMFYGAATDTHSCWLNNVFDREAAVLTTRFGSNLHEHDIATLLKNQFEDILDEAKARPVDLRPRHGGVHMLKTLWLKTVQFQGAM